MELDLQPGDVVKVLESAALGWVRARVIRVKSGGRVVVQSDQGREFTAEATKLGWERIYAKQKSSGHMWNMFQDFERLLIDILQGRITETESV